jgi:hypothetical protein
MPSTKGGRTVPKKPNKITVPPAALAAINERLAAFEGSLLALQTFVACIAAPRT